MVKNVLLNARNSAEAIKAIYGFRKEQNPKFSLSALCKKTGIQSRGYLSDVIHGKRLLNKQYLDSMAQALQLEEIGAQILRLLVDIDREKDGNEKLILERKIRLIRKTLNVDVVTMPGRWETVFFEIEVFCSFALFDNAPTLAQLVALFGEARRKAIEEALVHLMDNGVVERNSDTYGITKNRVYFPTRPNADQYNAYLDIIMAEAKQRLAKGPKDAEQYVFESIVVSTRLLDYLKDVPKIRKAFAETVYDLESDPADVLVRFNFQAYPVVYKP